MIRSAFRALLLVAMLLLGIGLATAQPATDEAKPTRLPPRRAPMGERPGFQPGGLGSQFFTLVDRVLTDDQKASLRTAMESRGDQMRDIEDKLRAAHRELLKAAMMEKFDEDSVRAKATEVSKLDIELAVLRAKAFSEMQPPLSPDQIQQLRRMPGRDGEGRPPRPTRDEIAPPPPADK